MSNPLRILLVDNLMIRRYGNLRMGPGRKLMCGAIRNNWRLCEFSDRDMARLLAPLWIRPWGGRIANEKLVLTAKNFRPDVILLGHCDYIQNWALERIREILPNVRMAHFNVDPVYWPHMQNQCKARMDSCDGIFVTTAGEPLKQWRTGKNFVAYMPNPSDPSMENQDNGAKTSFARDAFYACNPNPADPRIAFIAEMRTKLDAKMSFNFNRREGDLWYSSDRIAHLMGYGILTFQSAKNDLQHFFTEKELVFFDGADDLTEKVLWYQAHDAERTAVASAGRAKYHAIFNGARVLKFMVETLLGEPYSESYEWAEEVYR